MRRKQQTIKRPVEIEGIGLHTGEHVRLRLKPAEPDAGIAFVRVDLPRQPRIPVDPEHLIAKRRRSALAADGAQVHTVEHLLSALAAIGIDNIEIEVDGTEIPGMDGSALPFYKVLREDADVVEQDAEVVPYRIHEPITIAKGDVVLVALPASEGLHVSYVLDYDIPLLRSQFRSLSLEETRWVDEIAPARTFCLSSEVEALRELGLGKGANYENTLVVDGDTVINNTLRFPDECVRHKLLDLIGDLYLLGRPLVGHVIATKSGHLNNMELVQEIARQDAVRRGGPDVNTGLDINEIRKVLPHRYPMLLVDRILEIDEDAQRVVGLKNVSINEPFFNGHWPDKPVMPGVLILEAMAQVLGVLIQRAYRGKTKYAVLLTMDKVKFRRAAVPGDQVILEAQAVKLKARTAVVTTEARVEGTTIASAEIKVMLVDG